MRWFPGNWNGFYAERPMFSEAGETAGGSMRGTEPQDNGNQWSSREGGVGNGADARI